MMKEPKMSDAYPDVVKLAAERDALRKALENIELISTNAGGWFETDPWKWSQMMGEEARTALAPRQRDEQRGGDDWFMRHSDRRNPDAFINTNPAYFASECASAIVEGRLTPRQRDQPT
jgi:hypothetical protein